jgi:DNA polymerase (family 10)
MDKWQIAAALDEIARYVELGDPNPFRARAFERAARALQKIEIGVDQLIASGELTKTPGIGKATASIIEELARSGTSQYLEELRAQYPSGIFELLRVPKLGLRKIGVLHAELGVSNLADLEAAARAGKVAKLKGFGAKTQELVLKGIAFARERESRFLLPAGIEIADSIRERLASIGEIEDAEISGSIRRRLEVVQNVNIVIATKSAAKVIGAIEKRAIVAGLEEIDAMTYRGRIDEIVVYFHLARPDDFALLLLITTGSKEFVEAFVSRCKTTKARNEEELFEKCGIPYVEPERRETADDLTLRKPRPLIEATQLRGTFHVHTTFSDGRNTVAEMLAAARDRGFDYVGISDHSETAAYAGGLGDEKLRAQKVEIERERKSVAPMRVFRGTEADILTDGTIDYGAKRLAQFDFVIASVHSRFAMNKDEMTERILRALDDPHVTFLGHLTGRLLLSRDGYTMDFDRVFERAGEREVMIEINGNPNRLDIDWRHIKRALDRGVRFSINPDAHSVREYNALTTGTWVARKAGLSAREIFNTRPVEEVTDWLTARKQKAEGRRQK